MLLSCIKCKQTKPIEMFYKNKLRPLGVHYYCKECSKKIKEKYKSRYKEYHREYNRKHRPNYQQHKKHNETRMFGGQKEVVLARDNYRCVDCGIEQKEHHKKYGIDISVHHKDGKGEGSKIKNNNLDNLVTLCFSCHQKRHLTNKDRHSI